MTGPLVTGPLHDGSLWQVEPIANNASIISRIVDGRTVWGQTFARSYDHDGQVLDVLAQMEANPEDYYRWSNP